MLNTVISLMGGVDQNVAAFLSVTGITDQTQINALDFLVRSLKGSELSYNPTGLDLWTNAQVIHPILGGTAATHSYNVRNVNTFQITYNGGWTHSANGALPNGTTGYCAYGYIPSVQATVNGMCFGTYFRTNNTTGTRVYGATSLVGATTIYTDNSLSGGAFRSGDLGLISYTASPTTRLLLMRRTSNTFMEAYRDGTSLGTSTGAASSLPTFELYGGARNSGGGANFFCVHQEAFRYIGNYAMTNAEALALTAIINQYQTMLSRNV